MALTTVVMSEAFPPVGGRALEVVSTEEVVSMAAASPADSMVAAWLAGSMMAVVSTEVDFAVVNSTAVDFMIATSGDVSASASTRTATMTTTLTTIRMAIIRMPPAIHTLTTAVAMWSSDACTLRMDGACNPVRCAVDGLA